ncbi:hypothetical protein ACFFWD_34730 [Bradyrhizobium erythrophlei]
MTMTLVWTGVAFWLGLNAAFVARRAYVTMPRRTAATRILYVHLRRA